MEGKAVAGRFVELHCLPMKVKDLDVVPNVLVHIFFVDIMYFSLCFILLFQDLHGISDFIVVSLI